MSPIMIATNWVEALFPSYCVLCGAYGEASLCEDCAALCPPIGTHCRTCARAMARRDQACGQCLRKPPVIDALLVRWRYRDAVRRLVLGGKYHADKGRLCVLADGMATLLDDAPPVDAVIPMPISRLRLWQRGFNQTHVLGGVIARQLGVRMETTLLIKRHRPPQSRLHTHSARRRNIRHAFVCHREAPARVLLIDDVTTSGATLNEAARTLKQHGSTQVYALVAAALQL